MPGFGPQYGSRSKVTQSKFSALNVVGANAQKPSSFEGKPKGLKDILTSEPCIADKLLKDRSAKRPHKTCFPNQTQNQLQSGMFVRKELQMIAQNLSSYRSLLTQ